MDKEELTTRQQQILDYIRKCIEVKHYPPSVREISPGHRVVLPFHRPRSPQRPRGQRGSSNVMARSHVPWSSREARTRPAGAPRSSPCRVQRPLPRRASARRSRRRRHSDTRRAKHREEVPLPTSLFGDRNSFLLTVHGDSMINAGIYDGDTLLVREQSTANNGDIVVAMIDDRGNGQDVLQGKGLHSPATAQ